MQAGTPPRAIGFCGLGHRGMFSETHQNHRRFVGFIRTLVDVRIGAFRVPHDSLFFWGVTASRVWIQRFPKMVVPPNHPFYIIGFSIIIHALPPFMEPDLFQVTVCCGTNLRFVGKHLPFLADHSRSEL